MNFLVRIALALTLLAPNFAADLPRAQKTFLEKSCFECHDADAKKGNLDLTALSFDPAQKTNFATWTKIIDRVTAGEMPPAKKPRPEQAALSSFTNSLHATLLAADQKLIAREGRATRRRLNRYEYENTLRDLLQAPWLQIRDALPEDGEAARFNKIGDALDVSHVQMARYMAAADYALRQAMAPQAEPFAAKTERHYARDQRSFTGPMKFSVFNTAPERATFPVLGFEAQPAVRRGEAPITSTNAELRELEGVGVVASAYEPIEPKWNQFRAPTAGRYKLRFNAYTVWVGPGTNKWFIPDLDNISKGRRDEPITITAETPPRLLRHLGDFDITPEPTVHEIDTYLLAGEMIRPDAGRLFRSRPGPARWQNPLAEPDGQPGVVFRWLEVEGPLFESWPPPSHQILFGDLAIKNKPAEKASEETGQGRRNRFRPLPGVEVISENPSADADRLIASFLAKAYRRPTTPADSQPFRTVFDQATAKGNNFTDSILAAYIAILCSPEFIYLNEKPGKLDDYALASRLSFFLWNSPPDDELRALARNKKLRQPSELRAQTERLLSDPKSNRFVEAFLDYWLDLRKLNLTAPDAELYSDYYLDDLLVESALAETQLYFAELLRQNLPARNIVTSDFTMLNERLAAHYNLPPVEGVKLQPAKLPKDSVRGGLLTQASVLKVTANGTTTSPVLRGAWIMERILGQKPPPPPPNLPAVEPDIRGAHTIREQLAKHRTQESCNACHAKIDPPGFALENFDVMGAWRDHYRSETGKEPVKGLAKSGQKYTHHWSQPVDATGNMPDGRPFKDIKDFKQLLLENETEIARNLAIQLTTYATGATPRYSDRLRIEKILQATKGRNYPIRDLVHEIVQSELFLNK